MAYAKVVALNRFFSTFLHYTDAALPPEHLNAVEGAYKESKRLQDFMERLGSNNRKRMSATLQRFAEAAEEYLESADYRDDNFVKQIHSLIDALKKVQEECYSMLEDEEEAVSSSSKMIGILDELRKLKEELLIGQQNILLLVGKAGLTIRQQNILLLVGTAGIGKTALAREVFEDLDISECFTCRAWVTLSSEWRSEEVMEAILAQLDPDAHNKMVIGGQEEEKIECLKNILDRERCLIVVDDVWDHYAFQEKMKNVLFLKRDGNHTKFILISRINDSRLADTWNVFDKRLLNEEESWDLLREKAFVGGSCPPRLEKAGKKIAEKCDGLPLTIVTVAGLLSNGDESLWIDVAEKKKHELFIDAYDQISKVLYPSYENLNDEFKLAFLYMGVFPLKCRIHRSKLFNLWVAEEILCPTDYLPLDKAPSNFEYRSLIMICQRTATPSGLNKSHDTIRICRLHSSWWNLCQREARKINFFYVLDSYKDGLEKDIKNQTKLSMHTNVLFALKDVHKSMEENCASTVESLLCFGPYNQYTVPICYGLKLLQRLDAVNIRFYDFPLEVLELAKLIYLALTCNRQLPHSISKLEKLQYLIVHPHLSIKSSGAPSYMPVEIWDLEKLKHLQVIGNDLPDSGYKSLKNLSTLLDVSTASCTVLNRVPNLEKLRIRIELAPEAPDPLCYFGGISSLKKLKTVTCKVVNPGFKFQVVPTVASFPFLPYLLMKLSLSGLGYPWEEMRVIASSSPNLIVLKLQSNAFHGQIWELGNWDFQSLHFLLIEDLDLVKLIGGRESFKNLFHLSIKHCYKLEEIQMMEYESISRIEIVDSNPLIEKCIKEFMLENNHFPEELSVQSSWKSA